MGNKRKRTVVVALAPPRMNRKQARKITTQFHRLAHQNHYGTGTTCTTEKGHKEDAASIMETLRADYQRASQVSTSYFSTSKWVLGCLIHNGWYYGIRVVNEQNANADETLCSTLPKQERKRQLRERRPTRVLEIGAINTELLDAAEDTTRQAKLCVRAIDLHSMHEGRIEQVDFMKMPLPANNDPLLLFDVVVCSMVLNCVATPEDRGRMIQKIYSCLRPSGILFLTIPKTCLNVSPFINQKIFEDLLRAAGFDIQEHQKDSPKIAFFVATRTRTECLPPAVDSKWTKLKRIFRGQKYRNQFAVVLPEG